MLRMLAEWKIVLQAERKKAFTLAALVGVMGIMGIRQLIPMFRPSSAQAGASSGGGSVGEGVGEGPVTPHGVVVRVPRPGPVERDLFRFDPIYFPNPPESAPPDPVGQKSVEDPVDIALPEVAETPAARAQRVREALSVLRIRSVMTGTTPMAVIEVPAGKSRTTRLVRPGDRVMGFSVLGIEAGAVTLEMDGEVVELAPEL